MTTRKKPPDRYPTGTLSEPVPVMMPGCEPSPSDQKRAVELINAGLGKAELEIVASYPAPFYWIMRNSDTGKEILKSGTLFFLDTGEATFAVTAAHVITACLSDSRSPMFVRSMIGTNGRVSLPIDLGDRLIDAHEKIDIATFRISRDEIKHVGRTVLRGYQKNWPPRLAETDAPMTYCGFPGNGRRWVEPRVHTFGFVAMAGMVANASETCISIQIEREKLAQIWGDGPMPEDFDFGGMSGGPALAIVQRSDLIRAWKPAGVIFQGPNPTGDDSQSIQGLEIIRVRPIHFIKPDGMLDLDRWAQCNPVG